MEYRLWFCYIIVECSGTHSGILARIISGVSSNPKNVSSPGYKAVFNLFCSIGSATLLAVMAFCICVEVAY